MLIRANKNIDVGMIWTNNGRGCRIPAALTNVGGRSMHVNRVIRLSLAVGVLALAVAVGLPNDISTGFMTSREVFVTVGIVSLIICAIAAMAKFAPQPK